MKKTVFLVSYFIIIGLFGFSQNNLKFIYVPKDGNFKDTLTVTKFDKKYSFTSERVFYQDGSFSDSKIFCIKDTSYCNFYFKIDSNNNWLLKSSNKWVTFYSKKEKRIATVKDVNKNFLLKAKKAILLNGELIYSFTITSLKEKTVCGEGVYWFSPKYGVIAMEGTNFLLVRNDFSEKLK